MHPWGVLCSAGTPRQACCVPLTGGSSPPCRHTLNVLSTLASGLDAHHCEHVPLLAQHRPQVCMCTCAGHMANCVCSQQVHPKPSLHLRGPSTPTQVERVARQLGEALRSLQAMVQGRLPPDRQVTPRRGWALLVLSQLIPGITSPLAPATLSL